MVTALGNLLGKKTRYFIKIRKIREFQQIYPRASIPILKRPKSA